MIIERKSLPQAEYIKQDDIGLVLAKGMAVTYKANPKNPIDFFGKWLLNQVQIKKAEENFVKKKEYTLQNKEKHAYVVKQKQKQKEEINQQDKEKQLKIEKFTEKINQSDDLEEQLQDLVDHLMEFTNSSAVYIGKVCNPLKKIKEDDNDRAHIDNDSNPQILFQFSSSKHEFIVDKILKQEQGVTYDLFRESPKEDNDQEDNETEKKDEVENEILPKHILIPEVVREPRIHYYDVPKLGSYLTIKLEYQSCLSEDAFDAALQDYIEVEQKRADQAKEKQEFEDSQTQRKSEAEELGEEFKPESKEWPEIKNAPYKTTKIQYVVCLNTMGQDRQFTESEKLFALRCVQQFRDRWEEVETQNLLSDVKLKIERANYDQRYKEKYEDADNIELSRVVDEAIAYINHQEPDENSHPEEKNMIGFKTRFVQMTRTLHAPDQFLQHKAKLERIQKEQLRSGGGDRTSSALGSSAKEASQDDKFSIGGQYFPLAPEQWKEKIRELKKHYVMKFPRIFQSLFYLLKYQTKQTICERDTNKLQWKKTKLLINDEMFVRIGDYWPIGLKDDQYREYEKLKFIKTNIDQYVEEQVDEYSVALGKLLRWIKFAITARIEDVKNRRAIKKRLRQERQHAIQLEQNRLEKRKKTYEEQKELFDQKVEAQLAQRLAEGDDDDYRPEFDAEEFFLRFDEENYPIDIPDEIIDDLDNDFDIDIPNDPDEE